VFSGNANVKLFPLSAMSKPIDATQDQIRLAEAYAVLRQVQFHLSQPIPTPKATVDVRNAVKDYCADYESSLRGTPIKPFIHLIPESFNT
jgi:hypothetical protein